MARVTVLRNKFARSWPARVDRTGATKPFRTTDRAYVVELGRALARAYTTDAHFAAYVGTRGQHRLNSDAFEHGTSVEMTAAVFDIDGPEHVASPAWRRDIRQRLEELAKVHPSPYYYDTRGGARIIYTLPTPTILRDKQDAAEWSRQHAVAVAYLRRRFGIVADPACCDWQRLYRLPYVTRDGEPQKYPTLGDAHRIGHLRIWATREDVGLAEVLSRRAMVRRPQHVRARHEPSDGDGLFYHLLRARGDLGPQAPRAGDCGRAWIARCPNRANHRDNSDWTDRTIVYAAGPGKSLGMIHCYRGSCQGIVGTEWLRFFSADEIAEARKAATARAS